MTEKEKKPSSILHRGGSSLKKRKKRCGNKKIRINRAAKNAVKENSWETHYRKSGNTTER